jgi:hypothetical protein
LFNLVHGIYKEVFIALRGAIEAIVLVISCRLANGDSNTDIVCKFAGNPDCKNRARCVAQHRLSRAAARITRQIRWLHPRFEEPGDSNQRGTNAFRSHPIVSSHSHTWYTLLGVRALSMPDPPNENAQKAPGP